jgi:ATP-dependent protease Clp ATPase subunit
MGTLIVSSWRCQFCHNTASDVTQMIAGDSGFICDKCVRRCMSLLQPSDQDKQARPEQYLSEKA